MLINLLLLLITFLIIICQLFSIIHCLTKVTDLSFSTILGPSFNHLRFFWRTGGVNSRSIYQALKPFNSRWSSMKCRKQPNNNSRSSVRNDFGLKIIPDLQNVLTLFSQLTLKSPFTNNNRRLLRNV